MFRLDDAPLLQDLLSILRFEFYIVSGLNKFYRHVIIRHRKHQPRFVILHFTRNTLHRSIWNLERTTDKTTVAHNPHNAAAFIPVIGFNIVNSDGTDGAPSQDPRWTGMLDSSVLE